MKATAKRVLHSVAPRTFAAVMAWRSNRYARQVLEKDGMPVLQRAFIQAHGLQVRSGPFIGMRYIDMPVGSVFIPKLIGCYEQELHPHISEALEQPYNVIVDVGCAEGYYAVGMALHTPPATSIYAYDADPEAVRSCRRLAELNGVSTRVLTGAYCDPPELQRVLRGRALIICDCEGYEVDLLIPSAVPALIDCDLIVELHDLARPGITSELMSRFAATHEFILIDATSRNHTEYQWLECIPLDRRNRAVSEYRSGPQQWAVIRSRRYLTSGHTPRAGRPSEVLFSPPAKAH